MAFNLTANLNVAVNTGALKAAANQINSTLGSVNNLKIGTNSATFASIRPLKAQIVESTDAIENFGKQAGFAAKRFAAFSVTAGAMIGFIQTIKSAVGAAIDFDREMIRLSQVSNDSVQDVANVGQEITRLSTGLGVSSQDLVKVAVTLKQANLSLKDTKIALEAMAQAALAPNFDNLKDTTEGAIAIMNQFKISASGLSGALGAVNVVAGEFAVEAGDIIEAVRKTGGAFKAAGGNLNELIALFTAVRQTTRESAESIGTGLRTIFTRIQRNDTAAALKEVGINLRYTRDEAIALGDAGLTEQFVGPYEAVKRLSEGLNQLRSTDPRFSAIVEQLGGYRQISKVIPLIQEFGTAQKALGIAQAGSVSLALNAGQAQDALAVKLQKLKETFLDVGRNIVNSPGFRSLVDVFINGSTAALRLLDSLKGLIPVLAAIAAVKIGQGLVSFGTGFIKGAAGDGKTNRKADGGFIRMQKGGIVPGSGSGDKVPALLEPGEIVIPKKYAVGGTVLASKSPPTLRKRVYSDISEAERKKEFSEGKRLDPEDTIRYKIKEYQIQSQKSREGDANKQGKSFEDVAAKRLGAQKSAVSNAAIDLVKGNYPFEVKNTAEPVSSGKILDKLARFRLQTEGEKILSNVKGKNNELNLGEIGVVYNKAKVDADESGKFANKKLITITKNNAEKISKNAQERNKNYRSKMGFNEIPKIKLNQEIISLLKTSNVGIEKFGDISEQNRVVSLIASAGNKDSQLKMIANIRKQKGFAFGGPVYRQRFMNGNKVGLDGKTFLERSWNPGVEVLKKELKLVGRTKIAKPPVDSDMWERGVGFPKEMNSEEYQNTPDFIKMAEQYVGTRKANQYKRVIEHRRNYDELIRKHNEEMELREQPREALPYEVIPKDNIVSRTTQYSEDIKKYQGILYSPQNRRIQKQIDGLIPSIEQSIQGDALGNFSSYENMARSFDNTRQVNKNGEVKIKSSKSTMRHELGGHGLQYAAQKPGSRLANSTFGAIDMSKYSTRGEGSGLETYLAEAQAQFVEGRNPKEKLKKFRDFSSDMSYAAGYGSTFHRDVANSMLESSMVPTSNILKGVDNDTANSVLEKMVKDRYKPNSRTAKQKITGLKPVGTLGSVAFRFLGSSPQNQEDKAFLRLQKNGSINRFNGGPIYRQRFMEGNEARSKPFPKGLYPEEILGFTKGYIPQGPELTSAFRKAALIHHSDRGGLPENMAQVNAAFQRLKDRNDLKKARSQSGPKTTNTPPPPPKNNAQSEEQMFRSIFGDAPTKDEARSQWKGTNPETFTKPNKFDSFEAVRNASQFREKEELSKTMNASSAYSDRLRKAKRGYADGGDVVRQRFASGKFVAKDTEGNIVRDSVDGADEVEMAAKIRQMGYYVISLKLVTPKKNGRNTKSDEPENIAKNSVLPAIGGSGFGAIGATIGAIAGGPPGAWLGGALGAAAGVGVGLLGNKYVKSQHERDQDSFWKSLTNKKNESENEHVSFIKEFSSKENLSAMGKYAGIGSAIGGIGGALIGGLPGALAGSIIGGSVGASWKGSEIEEDRVAVNKLNEEIRDIDKKESKRTERKASRTIGRKANPIGRKSFIGQISETPSVPETTTSYPAYQQQFDSSSLAKIREERKKRLGYASGGLVPGTGNSDTVPMDLDEGSFVIKKSSVNKIGAQNLANVHKFKSGGKVPALLTPGEYVYSPSEAKKIGSSKLHQMNSYGELKKFAKGGEIGKTLVDDTLLSVPANVAKIKKALIKQLMSENRDLSKGQASQEASRIILDIEAKNTANKGVIQDVAQSDSNLKSMKGDLQAFQTLLKEDQKGLKAFESEVLSLTDSLGKLKNESLNLTQQEKDLAARIAAAETAKSTKQAAGADLTQENKKVVSAKKTVDDLNEKKIGMEKARQAKEDAATQKLAMAEQAKRTKEGQPVDLTRETKQLGNINGRIAILEERRRAKAGDVRAAATMSMLPGSPKPTDVIDAQIAEAKRQRDVLTNQMGNKKPDTKKEQKEIDKAKAQLAEAKKPIDSTDIDKKITAANAALASATAARAAKVSAGADTKKEDEIIRKLKEDEAKLNKKIGENAAQTILTGDKIKDTNKKIADVKQEILNREQDISVTTGAIAVEEKNRKDLVKKGQDLTRAYQTNAKGQTVNEKGELIGKKTSDRGTLKREIIQEQKRTGATGKEAKTIVASRMVDEYQEKVYQQQRSLAFAKGEKFDPDLARAKAADITQQAIDGKRKLSRDAQGNVVGDKKLGSQLEANNFRSDGTAGWRSRIFGGASLFNGKVNPQETKTKEEQQQDKAQRAANISSAIQTGSMFVAGAGAFIASGQKQDAGSAESLFSQKQGLGTLQEQDMGRTEEFKSRYQSAGALEKGTSYAAAGATAGAAVGAIGGPVGIAIGAGVGVALGGLVGALKGSNDGLKEAETAIRQVKIANALSTLQSVFERVSNGLMEINDSTINAITKSQDELSKQGSGEAFAKAGGEKGTADLFLEGSLSKGFSSLFGAKNAGFNVNEFNSQIAKNQQQDLSKQLVPLTNLLNKQAETLGKNSFNQAFQANPERAQNLNFNDIKKSLAEQFKSGNGGFNKDQMANIARARNISVEDVQKEMLKVVEESFKASKLAKAQQQATIAIESNMNSLMLLSNAFQAAALSVQSYSTALASNSGLFENRIQGPKLSSLSENFSISSTPDTAAFNDSLKQLSSGIGGKAGADFQAQGSALNAASQLLPSILASANANPLGGGDVASEISNALLEGLKAQGIVGEQASRIANSVGGNVSGQDYTKFLAESGGDVSKATEKLLANIKDPFLNAAKQISQNLENAGNEFTNGLVELANRQKAINSEVDRVNQLKLQKDKFQAGLKAEAAGRPSTASDYLSIQQELRPTEEKQRKLTGLNADAFSPEAVAAKLEQTQAKVQEKEKQIQKVDRGANGGETFRTASVELIKLKSEASNLTDALKGLADQSTKLSALQDRLSKLEEKRQQSLTIGRKLVTGGQQERVKFAQGQQLFNVAKSQNFDIRNFNDEQGKAIFEFLDNFGQGGKEIQDKILENLGFGLDKGQKVEKADLNTQIAKTLNDQITAQQEVVANQKNLQSDYFSNLDAQNKVFYANLEKFTNQMEKTSLENKKAREVQALTKIENVQKKSEFLTAAGVNDPDKLKFVKENRGLITDQLKLDKEKEVGKKQQLGLAQYNIGDGDTFTKIRDLIGGSTGAEQAKQVGDNSNSIEKKLIDQFNIGPEIAQLIRSQLSTNLSQNKGDVSAEQFIQAFKDALTTGQTQIGSNLNKKQEDITQRGGDNPLIQRIIAEAKARDMSVESFDSALNSVIELNKGIGDGLTNAANTAQATINALNLSIANIGRGVPPAVPPAANVVAAATGGAIFSPRGTDTVPAMLTPGEFVVNKNATQQNLPLLQSINSGKTSYLSKGGPVLYAAGGAKVEAVRADITARPELRKKYQEEIDNPFTIELLKEFDIEPKDKANNRIKNKVEVKYRSIQAAVNNDQAIMNKILNADFSDPKTKGEIEKQATPLLPIFRYVKVKDDIVAGAQIEQRKIEDQIPEINKKAEGFDPFNFDKFGKTNKELIKSNANNYEKKIAGWQIIENNLGRFGDIFSLRKIGDTNADFEDREERMILKNQGGARESYPRLTKSYERIGLLKKQEFIESLKNIDKKDFFDNLVAGDDVGFYSIYKELDTINDVFKDKSSVSFKQRNELKAYDNIMINSFKELKNLDSNNKKLSEENLLKAFMISEPEPKVSYEKIEPYRAIIGNDLTKRNGWKFKSKKIDPNQQALNVNEVNISAAIDKYIEELNIKKEALQGMPNQAAVAQIAPQVDPETERFQGLLGRGNLDEINAAIAAQRAFERANGGAGDPRKLAQLRLKKQLLERGRADLGGRSGRLAGASSFAQQYNNENKNVFNKRFVDVNAPTDAETTAFFKSEGNAKDLALTQLKGEFKAKALLGKLQVSPDQFAAMKREAKGDESLVYKQLMPFGEQAYNSILNNQPSNIPEANYLNQQKNPDADKKIIESSVKMFSFRKAMMSNAAQLLDLDNRYKGMAADGRFAEEAASPERAMGLNKVPSIYNARAHGEYEAYMLLRNKLAQFGVRDVGRFAQRGIQNRTAVSDRLEQAEGRKAGEKLKKKEGWYSFKGNKSVFGEDKGANLNIFGKDVIIDEVADNFSSSAPIGKRRAINKAVDLENLFPAVAQITATQVQDKIRRLAVAPDEQSKKESKNLDDIYTKLVKIKENFLNKQQVTFQSGNVDEYTYLNQMQNAQVLNDQGRYGKTFSYLDNEVKFTGTNQEGDEGSIFSKKDFINRTLIANDGNAYIKSIPAIKTENKDGREIKSEFFKRQATKITYEKSGDLKKMMENSASFKDLDNESKVLIEKIRNLMGLERVVELPAAGAQNAAKGGMINYLADGGVPSYAPNPDPSYFKPMGTDTVPAMLTPGEFVVNASATAKHGDLLSAINSGQDVSALALGGKVNYLAYGGRPKSSVEEYSRANNLEEGLPGDAVMARFEQGYMQEKAYAGSMYQSGGYGALAETGFGQDAAKAINISQEGMAGANTAASSGVSSVYDAIKQGGGADQAFGRLSFSNRDINRAGRYATGLNASYKQQQAMMEEARKQQEEWNNLPEAEKQRILAKQNVDQILTNAASNSLNVGQYKDRGYGSQVNLMQQRDKIWGTKNYDRYENMQVSSAMANANRNGRSVGQFQRYGRRPVDAVYAQQRASLSGRSGGYERGKYARFSKGGIAHLQFGGNVDNQPAMLSEGEFVVNKDSAKKHGGLLDYINKGKEVKKYSKGGGVGVTYLNDGGKTPNAPRASSPYTSNDAEKINSASTRMVTAAGMFSSTAKSTSDNASRMNDYSNSLDGVLSSFGENATSFSESINEFISGISDNFNKFDSILTDNFGSFNSSVSSFVASVDQLVTSISGMEVTHTHTHKWGDSLNVNVKLDDNGIINSAKLKQLVLDLIAGEQNTGM
jgi:hypothetical protein